MNVAAMIGQLQNLSLEKLKIIPKALPETAEDLEDIPGAPAVLCAPGIRIPMDEVRKIRVLENPI